MEKINKTTIDSTKYILVRQMKMFDWDVESERKINDKYTEITFIRDESVSYHKELVELEEEYFKIYKTIPMWLLIILAVFAFTFLTVFVIFGFINVGVMDFNVALLAFLLPGVIFVAILGILGMNSTRKSIYIANNEVNRDKMYLEKVEGLKHGN